LCDTFVLFCILNCMMDFLRLNTSGSVQFSGIQSCSLYKQTKEIARNYHRSLQEEGNWRLSNDIFSAIFKK